jgi:hypothetical protein
MLLKKKPFARRKNEGNVIATAGHFKEVMDRDLARSGIQALPDAVSQ